MFKRLIAGSLFGIVCAPFGAGLLATSVTDINNTLVCDDAASIITMQKLTAARAEVAHELAGIYRKRFVANVCLGGVAAAATGYVAYKWLAGSKDTVGPQEVSALTQQIQQLRVDIQGKELPSDKPDQKTPDKPGIFKRAWRGVKSGVGSLVSFGVYVGLSGLVGSWIAPFTAKATSAVEAFYRPLDLQWMINDRVRLPHMIAELQILAAKLDPKSTVFDDLTHVNVTIAGYNVARSEQRTFPVSVLDDLMRLHKAAQLSQVADLAGEQKRFAQIWQMCVDAIVRCVAFVQLRMNEDKTNGEMTEFDMQRLQNMCKHVIACTNALTCQMPQLLQATGSEKSSGLLAAVCQYSEDIMRSFAVVGDISVIGS